MINVSKIDHILFYLYDSKTIFASTYFLPTPLLKFNLMNTIYNIFQDFFMPEALIYCGGSPLATAGLKSIIKQPTVVSFKLVPTFIKTA